MTVIERIRDARNYGENSPARVGGLLEDLLDSMLLTAEPAPAPKRTITTVLGSSASEGDLTIDFGALGCSVMLDLDSSISGTLTLTPPTIAEGELIVIVLLVKQGSGGSKTINEWSGAVFSEDEGEQPALATTEGQVDMFAAFYDGTDQTLRFGRTPRVTS